MNISEKLSRSLDLLDEFQQIVSKPKKNQEIINFIEKLTTDLKKYNFSNQIIKSDLENKENKTKIIKIIDRIDNLNKLVLPKSKLSDEFIDYNSIK